MQQLETLGDLAQNLPPIPATQAYTGYALFTGTGQWEITVTEGGTRLGVIVVTVAKP